MFILYYRPTCGFCRRVLGEMKVMGLEVTLKDTSADPSLLKELIEKGGKKQVPCLVDEARDVVMYDSVEIIKYLHEFYGEEETSIDPSGMNVCLSCQ